MLVSNSDSLILIIDGHIYSTWSRDVLVSQQINACLFHSNFLQQLCKLLLLENIANLQTCQLTPHSHLPYRTP